MIVAAAQGEVVRLESTDADVERSGGTAGATPEGRPQPTASAATAVGRDVRLARLWGGGRVGCWPPRSGREMLPVERLGRGGEGGEACL